MRIVKGTDNMPHADFRPRGDLLVSRRRRVGGSGCADPEPRPVQRDADERGHPDGGSDGRCAGPPTCESCADRANPNPNQNPTLTLTLTLTVTLT